MLKYQQDPVTGALLPLAFSTHAKGRAFQRSPRCRHSRVGFSYSHCVWNLLPRALYLFIVIGRVTRILGLWPHLGLGKVCSPSLSSPSTELLQGDVVYMPSFSSFSESGHTTVAIWFWGFCFFNPSAEWSPCQQHFSVGVWSLKLCCEEQWNNTEREPYSESPAWQSHRRGPGP